MRILKVARAIMLVNLKMVKWLYYFLAVSRSIIFWHCQDLLYWHRISMIAWIPQPSDLLHSADCRSRWRCLLNSTSCGTEALDQAADPSRTLYDSTLQNSCKGCSFCSKWTKSSICFYKPLRLRKCWHIYDKQEGPFAKHSAGASDPGCFHWISDECIAGWLNLCEVFWDYPCSFFGTSNSRS